MNNFEKYYNHFLSNGYSADEAERMAILEVQADEIDSAEHNITLEMENEFLMGCDLGGQYDDEFGEWL